MNGERPGTSRSAPGGGRRSPRPGDGRCTAAREASASKRRANSRPAPPATTGGAGAGRARQEEPTPVDPRRCRASRRARRSTLRQGSQEPPEHPGSGAAPSTRRERVLRRALGPWSRPRPRRRGRTRRVRRIRRTGRRTAATPMSAATIARTTPIPASSAVLSFEPKVRIAKLFSHSGVASIAAPADGDDRRGPGIDDPATSCATPIATAPQTSPTTIPAPTCRSATGADVGVDGGATVRAIGPACAKDVARPLRRATLRHRSTAPACRRRMAEKEPVLLRL